MSTRQKIKWMIISVILISFCGTAYAGSQERSIIASYLFGIPLEEIDEATTGPGTGGVNYDYNTWGVDASGTCDGYENGHAGLDIQSKDVAGSLTTDRTFYAISEGEVIEAGTDSYHSIIIYDATLDITTLYLHVRSVDVTVGDVIEVGEALGVQGDTGAAGSEHVHLEVRDGEQYSPACGAGA